MMVYGEIRSGGSNTDFGMKIGFRYCIQKSCLLSAALSYWRYQEQHRDKIDVIAYFTKIGCIHWFKTDHIIPCESMTVPSFQLEVIGSREAGEERGI